MRKINRNSAGFTVIELLITLIVIGSTFGAFVLLFTTIQSINKKAIDVGKANQIAFAKVQDYENRNYNDLPNTTPTGTLIEVEDFSSSLPSNLPSPRLGKTYINTISSTLKQVIVTVEYGSGETIGRIQYADFIQANGQGR